MEAEEEARLKAEEEAQSKVGIQGLIQRGNEQHQPAETELITQKNPMRGGKGVQESKELASSDGEQTSEGQAAGQTEDGLGGTDEESTKLIWKGEQQDEFLAVRLSDILRAKSTFKGLGEMGIFVMYLCLAISIPFMLIPVGQPSSNSAATEACVQYTDSNGDTQKFSAGFNFIEQLGYNIGLYTALISESEDLGYADERVTVQSATVKAIEMELLYEKDSLSSVEKDAFEEALAPFDNKNEVDGLVCAQSTSGHWCKFSPYVGPNRNRTKSLEMLAKFEDYYMPLFAPVLTLSSGNILFQNDDHKSTGVMLTIMGMLGSSVIGAVFFSTRSLYEATPTNILRVMFEILYVFGFIFFAHDEYVDYRLTYSALGSRRPYFTSVWNILDVVSTIISSLFLLIYLPFILPPAERIFQEGTWDGPWPYLQSDKLEHIPSGGVLGMWQGAHGIMCLNFTMIFGRLFKYLRFHDGISVYINVFIKSGESMLDFGVWFFAVILMLTLGYFAFFSMVGANPDFTSMTSSLNTIGLLTMGFYDYETLYNNALGVGDIAPITTILFWVLVFLCIMFGQNIILATVGKAYDECSEEAEGSDTFIHTLVTRWKYTWMRRVRKVEGAEIPKEKRWSVLNRPVMDHSLEGTVAQIKERALAERRYREFEKWTSLSFGAMKGLYAYFQHPLHLNPELELFLWDGGEAVERANKSLKKGGKKPIWADEEDEFAQDHKAEIFLDRPLTLPQLKALFAEIRKCEELNNFEYFDLLKFSKCKLIDWGTSEEMDASITELFNAFARTEKAPKKAPKAALQAAAEKTAMRRAAGLFYNKRRNLTKTTLSIEERMLEFKHEQRNMKTMMEREQREINEIKEQLASIYDLLVKKS